MPEEPALQSCPVSPWCGAPERSIPRVVMCGSGVVLRGFSPAGSLQPCAESLLRNHLGIWQIKTLFSLHFLHDLEEG